MPVPVNSMAVEASPRELDGSRSELDGSRRGSRYVIPPVVNRLHGIELKEEVRVPLAMPMTMAMAMSNST